MTKKSLILALCALGLLAAARPARADVAEYDAELINNPTLSYSTTAVLDASRIDTLAMQTVYSSATISAFSLDDGRKATGTITVVSTQTLTSARIGVNGCSFTQGQEWTAVSTASGTAKAISDALAASTCLSGVVVSTWSSNVVYTTAAAIGTAGNSIALFSNTSSITVSGATLSNGDDSSFSVSNDDVTTSAAHGISTGFPMYLTTLTGTAPTGLTSGTTYYAIVTTPVKFKLASSSNNALAGTAVNITALTGSGTFSLTPTAFAGTYSWKWQASNDRTNWYDLPVSSTTYSAPGTDLLDGAIDYKYLRLNIVAGSGGGMNLKAVGFGKRRQQ